MTREEAIKIFREWTDEGFSYDGGYAVEELDDDGKEALEMAIKALSQEPTDAVSRQVVLKIIDGWYEQNRDTENIEDLIVLITYMDSVTQKSGKWVAHSDGGIWIKYYECSECGRGHTIHSDYCPNCGAKMFEPQESEDKE